MMISDSGEGGSKLRVGVNIKTPPQKRFGPPPPMIRYPPPPFGKALAHPLEEMGADQTKPT